jgi:hypothetical protein
MKLHATLFLAGALASAIVVQPAATALLPIPVGRSRSFMMPLAKTPQ